MKQTRINSRSPGAAEVNERRSANSANRAKGDDEFTCTEGQTTFPLSFEYDMGTDALLYFVGGWLQNKNAFAEVDERTVSTSPGLPAGTVVRIMEK